MSPAKAETSDQWVVMLDVLFGKVHQKPLAPADEKHEASPRMVIVLVDTKMSGQFSGADREQSNLNLRGIGITLMDRVFGDDLLLLFRLEGRDSPFRSITRSSGTCSPEL